MRSTATDWALFLSGEPAKRTALHNRAAAMSFAYGLPNVTFLKFQAHAYDVVETSHAADTISGLRQAGARRCADSPHENLLGDI